MCVFAREKECASVSFRPATLLVAELEETRDVPEALLARFTPTGAVDKFVAAFLSPSKRLGVRKVSEKWTYNQMAELCCLMLRWTKSYLQIW